MSLAGRTTLLVATPVLVTVAARWTKSCARTIAAVRVLRAVDTGSVVNSGSVTPREGRDGKDYGGTRGRHEPPERQQGISTEEDNS